MCSTRLGGRGGAGRLPCLVTVVGALAMAPPDRVVAAEGTSEPYFQIEVLDSQTRRGVPLVELQTTNAIRYVTDSNGVVAFREPGLMGREVFFFVKSHGYEFPADGFGMRGKALHVVPGGKGRLEVRRINIAERLYRLTGGGIYRDSMLVGRAVPIRAPALNGLVVGQDSVFTIVHRGRLYWFWGDTSRPAYPLGNFHTSGATSILPHKGGLDPEVGVDLRYFVDARGFARGMAPMSGDGPTWCDAFVTLRDAAGEERLYCAYAKIRPGTMDVTRRGIAVYDDENEVFRHLAAIPLDAPLYPRGHAFRHSEADVEYVYFATSYPLIRVRATAADYTALDRYETFSCLERGSRPEDGRVDRSAGGVARYSWKTNTHPMTPRDEQRLVDRGALRPEEALLQLCDPDSGRRVLAHNGSVYFNAFRNRWVMVTCEQFGASVLGETWFAEADSPIGPWVYGRKIVTHDRYSFYNPKEHPMFQKEGGRLVFFEGTYTSTFSGATDKTPRYDYNQILYKLDLADARLVLPVAVYRSRGTDARARWRTRERLPPGTTARRLAFFALDRPREGAVAVWEETGEDGFVRLRAGAPEGGGGPRSAAPVFYALPADQASAPPTTEPLFEYAKGGAGREYTIDPEWREPGFRRGGSPVCRVWRSPFAAAVAEELLRSAGES